MAQPARLVVLTLLLLALAWTLAVGTLSSKAAAIESREEVGAVAEAYVAPTPTPTSLPTPTPTSLPDPTSVLRLPSISYFDCEPCVVEPGGATTLRWDLIGASAAYLDGKGITAPGSSVVYPDQTTTYRLVAISEDGQSEKTVIVEVRGLPTIHYFTCLPCEVVKGEQSTLSWDLSGATAAYLDGHGVAAPGNTVVAPDQTTTYRLVAVGERGSVEHLVTVTVREAGDPETVSETLGRSGYDVRWVGYLQMAEGGDTVSVIMAAVTGDLHSQELADQYFQGFKTLYQNYPSDTLTVGLYDGMRYMLFVTTNAATVEAFLRGEMDGQVFWQAVTWNAWDEWTARWLEDEASGFAHQDFALKNFGF